MMRDAHVLTDKSAQAVAHKKERPLVLTMSASVAQIPAIIAQFLWTDSIVFLPEGRQTSQQIPGMSPDATLGHHTSPVNHRCVVSEGENACRRKFGWKKRLGPWLGFGLDCPGPFAVARQAVYENDAVHSHVTHCHKGNLYRPTYSVVATEVSPG